MNICVSRPPSPNEFIPVEKLQDKSFKEISSVLGVQCSQICIQTSDFIIPAQESSVLTKEFPQLIIKGKPGRYPPTPNHLKILESAATFKMAISVQILTKPDYVFPLMYVFLSESDIKSGTSESLLQMISKTFEYENSNRSISFEDSPLPSDVPISKIIEQRHQMALKFSCALSQSAAKRVGHRAFYCSQIKDSESTYIDDLNCLQSYWIPAFKASNIFSENEFKDLFREIPTILNSHTVFFQSLAKGKPSFEMEFAAPFLNFFPFFKLSATFVSNYKTMDAFIAKKRTSRSFESKYKEIEDGLPQGTGREFLSFYVTPVQRYPRYPLLIRDLDKYTPAFHPDKAFLAEAIKELDSINRDIDDSSHRTKKLEEMQQIQSIMPEGVSVIDSSRELKEKCKVRIISKKSGSGILYLFNDSVMLASIGKKVYTPLVFKPIIHFGFSDCKPTKDSIFITAEPDCYQIDFPDSNQKNSWMDAYGSTLESKFETIKAPNNFAKWTATPLTDDVPEVFCHSSAKLGSCAYFFGGLNPSKDFLNTLICYDSADESWSVETTPLPGRSDCCMAAWDDCIYVCFGQSKNGPLGDIWRYTESKKLWEKVKVVTPRSGQSCIAYEGKLVFFGGEIEKKPSNLLSELNLSTLKWEDFPNIQGSPKPRVGHRASLIGDYMAIVGGRGEKVFRSISLLNLRKNTWEKKCKLSPRADGEVILLGRCLFSFGGLIKDGDAEVEVVDTQTWKTLSIEFFGNSPPNLSKQGCVAIDEYKVLIFGGTNRLDHNRQYRAAWIMDSKGGIKEFPAESKKTIMPKAARKSLTLAVEQPKPLETDMEPKDIFNAPFNQNQFFAFLKIDTSKMPPMMVQATKIRASRLFSRMQANENSKAQIKKMEQMLGGSFDPPNGTPMLMKLYDDSTHIMRLIRVESGVMPEVLAERISEILKRRSVLMIIADGKKTQLDNESLKIAFRDTYVGKSRCLSISAL